MTHRAWQEIGSTLHLGNWGAANKRTMYKGVKPARDGGVLGPLAPSRLEGAGRKQLSGPGEGGPWGEWHDRSCGLWRASEHRQQSEPGKQYPNPLPIFPTPPMTQRNRSQEPGARGQSTQVSPQEHRRMENSRQWIWRGKLRLLCHNEIC